MMTTKLSVDAVVLYGSKLLLGRRVKQPFADRWVLPGGRVEPQDVSPRHALSREVVEEIGLRIQPQEWAPLWLLDSPGRDPRVARSVSLVYGVSIRAAAAPPVSPNLTELSELRWFGLEMSDYPTAGDWLAAYAALERESGFDHYQAIRNLTLLYRWSFT